MTIKEKEVRKIVTIINFGTCTIFQIKYEPR